MVLPFRLTMKLTRQPRIIAAFVALASMLFMQLVLAGYVCPKVNIEAAASEMMTMSTMSIGMPDCDQIDPVQPGLCHASAYAVHQSLDKHELPPVQPFVRAAMSLVLAGLVIPTSGNSSEFNTVRQSGAPPPPLAIRNCCFRI